MAKKLHWLVVNHLFWSDFEQLDWCLWKQLICTKFQQFWGNWPSSFAPYSHIFMMIPNIMGHLPLTEHIKAFSICFQLLGQQFDFSVFCSNSLAYGIVEDRTFLFTVWRTVASLILHHMVFSFAGIFCNEAYSKKGVFWHGVKQIWDTNQNQQAWKKLCWKNHWILPKKAKPLFFKLLFQQVKPLWKSKKMLQTGFN